MTKDNQPSARPPDYLGGTGRYMWQRIVPLLLEQYDMSVLDKTLIKELCINYQIMRESYQSLKDNGAQYCMDSGAIRSNPAIGDIDKASKNIRAACEQLGMSPKSRAGCIPAVLSEY